MYGAHVDQVRAATIGASVSVEEVAAAVQQKQYKLVTFTQGKNTSHTQ